MNGTPVKNPMDGLTPEEIVVKYGSYYKDNGRFFLIVMMEGSLKTVRYINETSDTYLFKEYHIPILREYCNPKTYKKVTDQYLDEIELITNAQALLQGDNFKSTMGDAEMFYIDVLKNTYLANFFWDNDIFHIPFLRKLDIHHLLKSVIAEKIVHSEFLDYSLLRVNGYEISYILADLKNKRMIWESGRLDKYLYRMDGDDILSLFRNIDYEDGKIYYDSGKLNLNKIKSKEAKDAIVKRFS